MQMAHLKILCSLALARPMHCSTLGTLHKSKAELPWPPSRGCPILLPAVRRWCDKYLECTDLPLSSDHIFKKYQKQLKGRVGKLGIPGQMYPSEREKGDASAERSVSYACMPLFGEDTVGGFLAHCPFGVWSTDMKATPGAWSGRRV